jgi:7-cyano-7-deazaguanine reductase
MTDTSKLVSLGSNKTKYSYDKPDAKLLERFESPAFERMAGPAGPGMRINISAPEFTSLCPVTGQPDFAEIIISYVPQKWCVESKSLKLYLMGFRQHGSFHEAITHEIACALIEFLDPLALIVEGRFTPRGGVKFWPKVEYIKPSHIVK